ncbi:site-specific DNA-methyltransferase [Shewanella sp. Arc9-LZ]|nr:site-specific DNA-methyltransferase [Shewanella sp. Arc9-LZ]
MEKITGSSPEAKSLDITQQNIEQLKQLFPDVFSENKIDFEALKTVLGEAVDDSEERYNFTWNGKNKARQIAQTPSTGTLRPCIEESVNWDTTENLFIEGDNLEVLKLLQKSYHKKVKMIYIDPPYNTGKDFVYKDNFNDNIKNYLESTGQLDSTGKRLSTNSEASGRYHSNWLNMIYPRLKLAKNLLKDDGVVAISIDENEVTNLRNICNEIFGEENFCGEIIWKNSSKNDQKYISMQHEYIVFYARNKQCNLGEWVEKKQGLDEIYSAFDKIKKKYPNDSKQVHKEILTWYNSLDKSSSALKNKHYSWSDEIGVYFPDNISGPNDGQYVYDVYHPVTGQVVKAPSRGWFCPETKILERIAENGVHFGDDHTTVPCLKTYLKNTEYQSLTSLRILDGRAASKRLQSLFDEKVFSNPKDEILLKDIFKAIGVTSDDIILDIFAGSATTAQAVFELNNDQKSECRTILIQFPEDLHEMAKTAVGVSKKITKNAIALLVEMDKPINICEISKERIRRAGKLYPTEIDVGFKNYLLQETNIRPWDADFDNLELVLQQATESIKDGRSSEDVLYEIFLKYGYDLTTPVETETVNDSFGKERQVFVVGAGALIVCLDDDITAEVVEGIAKLKEELDPETTQVVFKDAGFADSNVKTNAIQILKQAGINDVKSI